MPEWIEGEYRISTDKSLLSLDRICELLDQSYWANDRPRETVARSVENSLCFGVYHQERQIGFARVVTDQATIYWIGDVVIDPAYRGRGLGKKLIECIVTDVNLKDLRGILTTRDAHGLYEQYGFKRAKEGLFMRREPLTR